MITHEEIERAIGKLRELMACSNRTTGSEIVGAIVGYLSTDDACDKLIELLEQADPDGHMELPVDADGVPIHVGDELCGYGHPKGGVYCQAIINGWGVAVGTAPIPTDTSGWWLWNVSDIRHYHKLTVEDVLREFVNEWVEADSEGDIFAEYAAKLREVMNDE